MAMTMSRMKHCFPTAVLFLAAAISGVPTPQAPSSAFPDVTISLNNDISGANARATIAADGTSHLIDDLFLSTSVGASGHVDATSAQLTQIPVGVVCVIESADGDSVADLSDSHTFVDLDGDSEKLQIVVLDGATLTCEV
jgi:hypothetical protein